MSPPAVCAWSTRWAAPWGVARDSGRRGTGSALPRTNVFGLSNTAYRSDVLRRCLPIPAEAALVDWYLITRAWLQGARLAFDPTPGWTTASTDANMARIRPPFTAERVRADTALRPRALPAGAGRPRRGRCRPERREVREAAADVEAFDQRVVSNAAGLSNYVRALNAAPPPVLWWACVAHPSLRAYVEHPEGASMKTVNLGNVAVGERQPALHRRRGRLQPQRGHGSLPAADRRRRRGGRQRGQVPVVERIVPHRRRGVRAQSRATPTRRSTSARCARWCARTSSRPSSTSRPRDHCRERGIAFCSSAFSPGGGRPAGRTRRARSSRSPRWTSPTCRCSVRGPDGQPRGDLDGDGDPGRDRAGRGHRACRGQRADRAAALRLHLPAGARRPSTCATWRRCARPSTCPWGSATTRWERPSRWRPSLWAPASSRSTSPSTRTWPAGTTPSRPIPPSCGPSSSEGAQRLRGAGQRPRASVTEAEIEKRQPVPPQPGARAAAAGRARPRRGTTWTPSVRAPASAPDELRYVVGRRLADGCRRGPRAPLGGPAVDQSPLPRRRLMARHRLRRPLHGHRRAAARIGGGDLRAAQGDLRAGARAERASCSAGCRRARSTWAASRPPCRRWSTRTCWPTTTPGTRSTPCSRECMSPGFRDRVARLRRAAAGSTTGSAWTTWTTTLNPRRRDMGYHNVFDHYRERPARDRLVRRTALHFHYHPHNFRREAHRCATHWWASSDSLGQILSRRVIDRRWFPAANRPGFHVIRPDSHWFLEQFVPVRLLQPGHGAAEADGCAQAGLDGGRWGDWRRAPATWEPYHPAHDDYQDAGRLPSLDRPLPQRRHPVPAADESDVRQAFARRARAGPWCWPSPTTTSATCGPTSTSVRGLLRRGRDYPGVPFRFSEAVAAMRGGAAAPAAARLRARGLSLGRAATAPTSSTSGRTSRPSVPSRGWLSRRWQARTTTTTSTSTSRSTAGATCSTRRPSRSAPSSAIGVAANNSYGVTTVVTVDPATATASRRVARRSVGRRRGRARGLIMDDERPEASSRPSSRRRSSPSPRPSPNWTRPAPAALVLCDRTGSVAGLLTDGDIRRAILRKVSARRPVRTIATPEPVVARAPIRTGRSAQVMIQRDINHLPVVDEAAILVDFLLRKNLVVEARRPLGRHHGRRLRQAPACR